MQKRIMRWVEESMVQSLGFGVSQAPPERPSESLLGLQSALLQRARRCQVTLPGANRGRAMVLFFIGAPWRPPSSPLRRGRRAFRALFSSARAAFRMKDFLGYGFKGASFGNGG